MSAVHQPDLGQYARHVKVAFDNRPELAEDFLRELRVSWREVVVRTRRMGFLVTLFIGLFLLLEGASIAEIAFGGVKLAPSAVDTIAIAIPAVTAYLFSEFWGLSVMAERFEDLHDEICRQTHPSAGALLNALHPPETDHPGFHDFLVLGRDSPRDVFTIVTSIVALVVTLFGPFGFLLLSYVLLVGDFGIGKPELLGSLAFSLFCSLRAIGYIRIS